MGIKAGLQILQQTGKAIASYANDVVRLVPKSGDGVTRAVAAKADNAISVFTIKAENVVETVTKNTDEFVRTSKTKVLPPAQQASTVATHSVDEAGNVVLKEHGLSEIMSETFHKPSIIEQTPVHSPIRPELPEHYVKVEGQIFEYPAEIQWDFKLKKHVVNKATRYEITQSKDGVNYYIQFYDDLGYQIGARQEVRHASSKTKLEIAQMFEELKNRPKAPKPTSTTPVETWVEKTIKGLAEPKGSVSRRIALDDEGNTIVRFLDDKDSFIRKVKIDPSGTVLEYTNFRTLMSGQGIDDAYYGGNFAGGSFSSRLRDETLLSEVSFDELKSEYMRIREQSRYILDFDGNVARTIHTRRFTPHIKGKVGETPIIITVDTRSMNNGKFVEDVVLTKGDKRFSRSFWFNQKTGSVHYMDGLCNGLTKEEIELIKSDPYLASRYIGDGINFVRTEKFNSYRAQNLRDKQTPIYFDPPHGNELGYYSHSGHINLTPSTVRSDNKPSLVNTLNHESRHGFQHQMVDDLNAGLLQGNEKAQAEMFADNFSHYKSLDSDFDGYWNQAVEVDARHHGEAAKKQFEEFGEKINKIFFDA